MVDIITDEELASYLQTEVNSAITLVAEKTNELITEKWEQPPADGEPVPTSVWSLAINVAARAAANPKGLTSWTESWDDITLTERVESSTLRQLGLYLTDDELIELNGGRGARVGSIRVLAPRWGHTC